MKNLQSENLKLAASLKLSFGIDDLPKTIDSLLRSLKKSEVPPLIYIKGKTCTGCSVSLLNFTNQSPAKLIINHDNLVTTGGNISPYNIAIDLIRRYTSGKIGPYFFALEGSIPKNPAACYMANRPIHDWIQRAGKTCLSAVSFGNCATMGDPNSTTKSDNDYFSLEEYFKQQNINKPVVHVPGCPVGQEHIVNLITQLVRHQFPHILDRKKEDKYTLKTA
ncbi:MAG: hypothetical protein ACLFQM_10055 [Fidelibacterota bacterium]